MVSSPRCQAACSNKATRACPSPRRRYSSQFVLSGRKFIKIQTFINRIKKKKKKITRVDLLAKEPGLRPLSLRCWEMHPTPGRGVGSEMGSGADTLDVLLPAVLPREHPPDALPYARSTVDTDDSTLPPFWVRAVPHSGAEKGNAPEAIKFLMSLTHAMHKNDPCSSSPGPLS